MSHVYARITYNTYHSCITLRISELLCKNVCSDQDEAHEAQNNVILTDREYIGAIWRIRLNDPLHTITVPTRNLSSHTTCSTMPAAVAQHTTAATSSHATVNVFIIV